jgi:ubiquitin carboxyl-terminal hydrolase 34
LKRTCIKTLPNVLLLHLKRFDFDFDTMRNEKVNDYCEFPLFLDMEPYTREGLAKREREKKEKSNEAKERKDEDEEEGTKDSDSTDLPLFPREYYEYELRGVLVHRGVADSGHYYSFIKERGNWYKFNDEKVSSFNLEQLSHECFGGQETLSQYSEKTKSYVRKTVPITHNAYMLFYERKQSIPFETNCSSIEGSEVIFYV